MTMTKYFCFCHEDTEVPLAVAAICFKLKCLWLPNLSV